MPEPYYQDDLVTIYHGDCREWMPEADVIVTDPPYGIGWRPRVTHRNGPWVDDVAFDPSPFLSIGKAHLFWGANHFAHLLPSSPAWLAWVKRPIDGDFNSDKRSYSTMELAWTDFATGARFHAQVWDGGKRAGRPVNREFNHPAQKPMELMLWCVAMAPPGTILDPFMGSGTTLAAAKELGRKSIGIEIEERYCEIAAQRCSQEVLGLEIAQ